jgi:hypothetical protein
MISAIVSMTSNIETAFVAAMGGGVLLNNRLTDFAFRTARRLGRPVAAASGQQAPALSMARTWCLPMVSCMPFSGRPAVPIHRLRGADTGQPARLGLAAQEAISLPHAAHGISDLKPAQRSRTLRRRWPAQL